MAAGAAIEEEVVGVAAGAAVEEEVVGVNGEYKTFLQGLFHILVANKLQEYLFLIIRFSHSLFLTKQMNVVTVTIETFKYQKISEILYDKSVYILLEKSSNIQFKLPTERNFLS